MLGNFKGALDNSASSPDFFQKVEISIPLEVIPM